MAFFLGQLTRYGGIWEISSLIIGTVSGTVGQHRVLIARGTRSSFDGLFVGHSTAPMGSRANGTFWSAQSGLPAPIGSTALSAFNAPQSVQRIFCAKPFDGCNGCTTFLLSERSPSATTAKWHFPSSPAPAFPANSFPNATIRI